MGTAERSVPSSGVGTPLVVDLGELRASDLPRVGGKAANLGELIAAEAPESDVDAQFGGPPRSVKLEITYLVV